MLLEVHSTLIIHARIRCQTVPASWEKRSVADPIALAIYQLLHPLLERSAKTFNIQGLVDLLHWVVGRPRKLRNLQLPGGQQRFLEVLRITSPKYRSYFWTGLYAGAAAPQFPGEKNAREVHALRWERQSGSVAAVRKGGERPVKS